MLDSPSQYNSFKVPFIATPKKIERIDEIARKALDGEGVELTCDYEVESRDGRKSKPNTLCEVFDLDNTVRNPCCNLELSYTAKPTGISIPTAENGVRVVRIIFSSDTNTIRLSVRAKEFAWCRSMFDDLEAQIERTIPKGLIYRLRRTSSNTVFFVAMSMIYALIIALFASTISFSNVRSPGFNDDELSQLRESLKTIDDPTSKLDFIVQYLAASISPPPPSDSWFSADEILADLLKLPMLIGILILIGVLAYLWYVCYPMHVFDWGDYGEHYQSIVKFRWALWGTVVIMLPLSYLVGLTT